ncbi:MAG: N-acetylmuramoyl-L-alanine amidase [Pseudomonadota bacterium]|nr:N-acetylmuramoyl-L-alanine amidase [Pseudomonadota bacterium]
MFKSYSVNNHRMNIPEDDIFLKGKEIVYFPIENSPDAEHFDERIHKGTKQPTEIDQLIIHCSFETDIERVLKEKNYAGAHYVIHRDGTILQCVDESRRAYHAGISSWAEVLGGADNINAHAIGIEVENPTFGSTTEYTPEQMDSLIRLSKSIIARHHIKPHNVIGHSDVSPDRKADPGVLFPWRKLAEAGIGIFPKYTVLPSEQMMVSGEDLRKLLKTIGYKTETETKKIEGYTEITEIKDNLPFAWRSFMRHFMPFGITDERPTPQQIRERREKAPHKSTEEILSDASLDFMVAYEKNTNLDSQKHVIRVSSSGFKRLKVVAYAFQQSRLKSR